MSASASASAEPQSTSSESQIRPRRPESFQQLAEQVLGDFRESKALQSPDKWGVARDLFERLAGNPLSGELVNEVRLILSEDGNAYQFRLVFVINMTTNPTLCAKLGVSPPPQTIHLRVKINIVDNISSDRKYNYWAKLAVLPRDRERFSHELKLINGTLEGVRLFHIMDLLATAAHSFGSDEPDLPLSRSEDSSDIDGWKRFAFDQSAHLCAIIAYVARHLCSEWTSTGVWGTSDPSVRKALDPLHSGLFDVDCYESARRIFTTFLGRWGVGDRLDIKECPERLKLSACPNDMVPLFSAPRPSNCNLLIQRDAGEEARKHELGPFCRLLCRSRLSECPEAYASITKAIWYRNIKSPVNHEFVVVEASMGEEELWVRLDRSRQGKQAETFVWKAFDTAQIGTKTQGYRRAGERLELVSQLQFHNVEGRRRLPQLRDLSILISTLRHHHPAYVALEANCYFISQVLIAALRIFFGGSWKGEGLDWIEPYIDEYVAHCHAAYSETSADYWRTYNGQGEIGNLSAMTLQEVKDSVADPVLLELGLMGNDTTLDQIPEPIDRRDYRQKWKLPWIILLSKRGRNLISLPFKKVVAKIERIMGQRR